MHETSNVLPGLPVIPQLLPHYNPSTQLIFFYFNHLSKYINASYFFNFSVVKASILFKIKCNVRLDF